jgi:hypothetical protein
MGSSGPGRVRVERGIYRQPNGKYAVCWRHAGRLHFRTVHQLRRTGCSAKTAATREGKVPVSPRLRFETVAGQWLERFEAKVAAGERHPRTLEAPKTPASVRDVPLVPQLARLLSAHRQRNRFATGEDWVFATARGTPAAIATSTAAASAGPPSSPG